MKRGSNHRNRGPHFGTEATYRHVLSICAQGSPHPALEQRLSCIHDGPLGRCSIAGTLMNHSPWLSAHGPMCESWTMGIMRLSVP